MGKHILKICAAAFLLSIGGAAVAQQSASGTTPPSRGTSARSAAAGVNGTPGSPGIPGVPGAIPGASTNPIVGAATTNAGSSGALGAGTTSGTMNSGPLTEERVRQIIREELQRAGITTASSIRPSAGGTGSGTGSVIGSGSTTNRAATAPPITPGVGLTNRTPATPPITPGTTTPGAGTRPPSGATGVGTSTGTGAGTSTRTGTGTSGGTPR